MKNILTIMLLVCISGIVSAATSITTPTVSGHWSIVGSPYKIYNNVTVNYGQTLIIDSGVNVIFQGNYYMDVSGKLLTYGAPAMPVVFDIADSTGFHIDVFGDTSGGWRGIFFNYYSPDTSILSYCNFHHLKKGLISVGAVLQVRNCLFSYNMGRILDFYSLVPRVNLVENCSFHDNYATYGALMYMLNSESRVQFINNNIYDNKVGIFGALINCINSTMQVSGNNIHHNYVHPGIDSVVQVEMLAFRSYGTRHCNAIVSGNRIYENTSLLVAPLAGFYANLDISNNYICNNHNTVFGTCPYGYGGGGIYMIGNGDYGDMYGSSTYTVRNNVIANNYSSIFGGGIFMLNAKALISGNTIVNNKAPRGGGVDILASDTITMCLRNNIFYGNENEGHPEEKGDIAFLTVLKAEIRFDHNWTDTAWYGYITTSRGSPPFSSVTHLSDLGTNITGANPGFVNATLTSDYTESALLADFSLMPGSPCINSGADSAVVAGSTDFYGNNRIYDTADIGAIEFGASVAGVATAVPQDTMFYYCCNSITRYDFVLPVGVSQNVAAPVISCYPNPASNLLFITTPTPAGTLQLLDMAGAVVGSSLVSSTLTTIDIHSLPRGVYYAMWMYQSRRTIQKVVVE